MNDEGQPLLEAATLSTTEMWRLNSFLRLGFSYDQAEQLAFSDSDLETARRLVAAGCPLVIAVRLL